MLINEFLKIYALITNEFRILNTHFDEMANSKTESYNQVFLRWKKDMFKLFKNIDISMHWSKSSLLISGNQILFDTSYKDDFFFELKYDFSSKLITDYKSLISGYMETIRMIGDQFYKFNNEYDTEKYPRIKEYELKFSAWKKNITKNSDDAIIDYHWKNKRDLISINPVFLTVMFRDDFLCEIKYNFNKDTRENIAIKDLSDNIF